MNKSQLKRIQKATSTLQNYSPRFKGYYFENVKIEENKSGEISVSFTFINPNDSDLQKIYNDIRVVILIGKRGGLRWSYISEGFDEVRKKYHRLYLG